MILNDYLVSCDHKPELTQNIINISNLPKQGRPKKKAKIEIPSDSLKIKEALPTRPLETLSEAFYKLNTSKLDKEMTSELISKYVSSKTTLNSAIISEVFYKLGYRSVTKAEIMSQLPKVPKLSSEAVETCLEQLEKSSIIENDSEISWRINLPQIFNNLSAFTLEKIIQGKFGDYAGRVFRILYNKGLLDDKNISDLTLLPLRETNSCLNELFSAGFVFSKTVGASQMYYGVKIDDVREDLLRQCFKSVLNLKIKLASEMEEVWGLVQRAGHLTADEKHALERYKIIEARIESAILELDRTILVLSLH
jgi:DNA-directed RNA polymerase III subunit RPC3